MEAERYNEQEYSQLVPTLRERSMSMNDNRETFRVSWRIVITNWGKAVLLGSIAWPVFAGLTKIGSFEWSHIGDLIVAWLLGSLISLLVSAMFSVPALLLLIGTCELLNKRDLSFRFYRLWQNAAHVAIAAVTFVVINSYFSETSDQEFMLLLIIAFIYTLAGLYIWNKMYYRIYKTIKNS